MYAQMARTIHTTFVIAESLIIWYGVDKMCSAKKNRRSCDNLSQTKNETFEIARKKALAEGE